MNETIPICSQPISFPNDQNASGRTLGAEELQLLETVIKSGTLTSTKGTAVKQFEKNIAELFGVDHAFACASGTAAIHCAVAAIDPEPGDEIVTTPITDMGALTPIIYQAAIPVFADVDPVTVNVTAESIERVLSERTRAIIVTHLFGNPAEMSEIMALAQARNIPVIEDAAQAFLATHNSKKIGTIGSIGCFSLQQGKHITTGEGGFVITNDAALARRMRLFIDKAWGYGDPNPDHYFLALNYRMTELQGAVALAQLGKLEHGVIQRQAMADRLNDILQDCKGIVTPHAATGSTHAYWRYCLMIDKDLIAGGPGALGSALKEHSIASAPRYIQKPAFECAVIKEQNTFGRSKFPFTLARPEAIDYSPTLFPGSYQALDRVLVLPWNERYQEQHVDYFGNRIHMELDKLI